MANIDVTAFTSAGVNNEMGRGWTHVATVKFTDFVANPSATDGDTLTFALASIQYSIVDCWIPLDHSVQRPCLRWWREFDDPTR
jgi:hypothetical protein